MEGVFYNCSSLKKIKISPLFKTSNAENMSYMFYACKNLKVLDLSPFETYKLKNISFMFFHCYSLRKIDLSSFYLNPNCEKYGIFYKCDSLNQVICYDDCIKELFEIELQRRMKNKQSCVNHIKRKLIILY